MKAFVVLAMCGLVGCGSDTVPGEPDARSGLSGFAGTYSASYSGTWQNATPNTLSGSNTDTATIIVTDEAAGEIKLTWQVPPNPASGSVLFTYSGSTGTAVKGTGVGGNCFMGVLNGNQQTNCCDTCTITFAGAGFSQPNAGHYNGTTAQNVAYTGTYAGTWLGTRQ